MPVTVTYPGVYLQEIPSGNHTVTPVATNIAAFVGRAPFGPTDLPATIFNYADYIRAFGGLSFDYPMSYAVQDFFANGGSQAIICRLFEPSGGDGCARLRFAGSPPALPLKWEIDAKVSKGAKQVAVHAPQDPEGEPVIGQMFYIDGDKSLQYVVTNYSDASGKTPATLSFLPGLAKDFQQCTSLDFSVGPDAAGWSVGGYSAGQIALTGGAGIPEVGDRLTVAGNPQSYAIVAEPVVTGGDNPDNLQVSVKIWPTPAAVAFGAAVTIGDPQSLAMPAGWEIDKSSKPGSVTLINGGGDPLVGDTFTLGSKSTVYTVTKFTRGDDKNQASMDFTPPTADPAKCHCCAPVFTRGAPSSSGWTLKSGPKENAVSLTVVPGQGATGVVDVGDTFQADGDDRVYSVRYVVPATGSSTVYFLPGASKTLAAAKSITFQPPLTLRAANPGGWGNFLVAMVDVKGISTTTAKQFQDEFGLTVDDLFNITLIQKDARGRLVKSERYLNVSVRKEGSAALYPNRLDRVLATQSNLARVDALSALPPGDGATAGGIGGNDGTYLEPGTYIGDQDQKTGIYLLEHAPIFNLLCVPPDRRVLDDVPQGEQDLPTPVRAIAATYCTDRRAFFIVDPPVEWIDKVNQGDLSEIDPDSIGITGENASGIQVARNAAVYFPRVMKPDLMMKSQPALFAPCGIVAGVMAATDVARGVWKAPAGTSAGLAGVSNLEFNLTDNENGLLNPLGINCLRNFPVIGPVVWGARTLRGADAFDDDYKYVPVRRLTLFIESSVLNATQWAVFEPNNEALWSSLRLQVSSFLAGLSQQGAFYNYAVACDATTTTPDDIALGVVNMLIQIAPVKPAEFFVISIQQTAGAKPA
jgi:uncharacterized protein